MGFSHCSQKTNLCLILVVNLCLLIHGQYYLPNECLSTFDNATASSTTVNGSLFVCPSSCYTERYLSNQEAYPVFGNESYSGNSLVCKAALHDGRVAPWNGQFSATLIRSSSLGSSTFTSALRNGILSGKLVASSYSVYQFANPRINEASIPDVAIEHRGYLYAQSEPSSIVCRSKQDLYPIQPIEIDHGWRHWPGNRLKYFTFPRSLSRNESLTFCLKNNATLMYWTNSTEQRMLQEVLSTTIYELFHYQRASANNETLTFFIGLKQINRVKSWESNLSGTYSSIRTVSSGKSNCISPLYGMKQVVPYNESLGLNPSSLATGRDFCTVIYADGSNGQSLTIADHECDNANLHGYPLCRLLPSATTDESDFVYRLETDGEPKNLLGVISFCSELGGYPVYANNAYEWQLVQEIMLTDPRFTSDYVYTGLLSPTKDVREAYWMPMNVSYNDSLSYVWFASNRGAERTGYHLSKAAEESYYALYDIDPFSTLNTLRFCRKNDVRQLMRPSTLCDHNACLSKCLNATLPSQSDDARFGFYACKPKASLVGIVYTQSLPEYADFIRPSLPMEYGVVLRRRFDVPLVLSFEQIDKDLRAACYQYVNFDRLSTMNDTVALTCDSANTKNKTLTGISIRRNFNGLLSFSLDGRRMSGHHTRFIDYQLHDTQCRDQGILHPYVQGCICAPGFYGSECQFSCPPGYYGQTCDFHCRGDDDYCKGLLICLPDPYGCSCYTGWYGTNCNISCPEHRYGPNCAYNCSCSTCNRFTGVCNCSGTECYQGPHNRLELQSRCVSPPASSSSSLALLIVIPIISVIVMISIIAIALYWRLILSKRRRTDGGLSRRPNNITDEHL